MIRAGLLRPSAAVALLVVLAACGRGEGEASISRSPVSQAPAFAATVTTTTLGAAAVPVAPETTVRPGAGAPTPTAGPSPDASPSTPAGPTAPAALTPADPGTYRYDTSGQSRFGAGTNPFPGVTTLVVDRPVGTTQHATRDLRDASHNGPVLESVLDYRADGIYLVSLKASATLLLFTQTQELRPPSPVLLLPTDARPGLHRELDLPAQAGTAHLTLDVQRQERLTIGGQSVATTVVHLTATVPSQLAGRLDFTVWVAPAYRLWVRERFVGEAVGTDGQVVYRSDYDATLQRLTPS